MKVSRIIAGMLSLFITLPIWFFLMHTLLVFARVDRLVWFLYWVYVPLVLFISTIEKVTSKN